LENFGGLTITPPTDKANLFYPAPFTFDPVQAASGEFDRFELWQQQCDALLFPLADRGQGAIMMFAECGRIISGWMDHLDLEGNTLEEALELLIFARAYPVPLAGPRRWWQHDEEGE
jgi:hypothetical protein